MFHVSSYAEVYCERQSQDMKLCMDLQKKGFVEATYSRVVGIRLLIFTYKFGAFLYNSLGGFITTEIY